MRGIIVALAFLVAACGGTAPTPTASPTAAPTTAPHAITGTVTLHDKALVGFFAVDGQKCWGIGGYDDLVPGGTVTVRDAEGVIVGTGTLGDGARNVYDCTFPFTVADVPASSFYTVAITHRDPITYKATDISAAGWQVAIGVGDR